MNHAVCYFFSFLMEAAILWLYSSGLFAARHSIRTRLAVLCGSYSALFLISLFELKWLNAAAYFLFSLIFLTTQYRLGRYAAFIHAAVLTAVMGTGELAVYGIAKRFAPHFYTDGKTSHLLIHAAFSKLIFFTAICLLIHSMRPQRNDGGQPDRYGFPLVFIPAASIFLMLTFIYIGETSALLPPLGWMLAFSAIFLLAMNLLVLGFYQYIQRKNAEFTHLQLLLQKESDSMEYYEMLRRQNENQRILIHDIKKHLQSIALLNEQKEHDKINAYIQQLTQSSDLKESARLCSHELLNSILCRYAQQCADSHISFHTDIRSKTVDFIADNDLTSLFCNLLDNAFAAADGIPDSFIELTVFRRRNTPFVIITVINSCRKDPFPVEDGQQNGHGFGLKSIRRTVSKYHGDIQMHYDHDAFTFHTFIALKPGCQS